MFQKEVPSAAENQEREASERDIGCEAWEASSPPEEQASSEGGGQCRELVSIVLSKSVTSLRVGTWIEGHLV